jgi:hypothetical protein
MPGGELSVRARLHPSGLWVTIPLRVGGSRLLPMVVDSGAPISAISPEIAAELAELKLLGQDAHPPYQYRLSGISLQGRALPDLQVRVLPRLTRLRVDGLVELDFLRQFAAIHFYVATLRLVLDEA